MDQTLLLIGVGAALSVKLRPPDRVRRGSVRALPAPSSEAVTERTSQALTETLSLAAASSMRTLSGSGSRRVNLAAGP